ncbi:hypothetical protein [Maribacter hydrothermalis]|uniref:Uncharacterized protein n=1 Tax=Maribacter hydrothermalis TaxID=1836467 RepID=A0A1B7Z870_9FLAO|nr:hypothetical protein [Maribacter hydrothermalis]APQ19109.1 hypothetical protein BTR34_18060 [Maribacter hydrothermalis]OBR38879.1 hypothetical protein A9200_04225 [Maribacter hydrothermalis]
MRKILIPTDFTVDSLQLIEYAILNYPDTKLDIVLIAGYRLPDTRWGIAHFSKTDKVRKQVSKSFKDSQRRIEIEHKINIETVSFDLFTGLNSCAFQNFLEQINVEDAIVPKQKVLSGTNKRWFDTTNFIKKNVKNVIEVPIEQSAEITDKKYSFIGLFNL